jgi:hypothetical protein
MAADARYAIDDFLKLMIPAEYAISLKAPTLHRWPIS